MPFLFNFNILDDGEEARPMLLPSLQGQVAGRVSSAGEAVGKPFLPGQPSLETQYSDRCRQAFVERDAVRL